MINFYQTELDILYSKNTDASFIQSIKIVLLGYKRQIDYNCSRFIDQYGQKLDVERNDKYHKFMKIQSEQYAKITRLEKVIHAYIKK
jgi:hypothetical protein